MLPAPSRLRRRADFQQTLRRGRSAGRALLVVHMLVPGGTDPADVAVGPPRVGFVVGRAVGGAVVRNRVRRQLRHLCAARLDRLPAGALVVVRARPSAAGAGSAALADDLDAALDRLARPGGAPRRPAAPGVGGRR